VTAPSTVRACRTRTRLGDRVLVGLPVPGARVTAGRTADEVESTGGVSGGRTPELINSDACRVGARTHGRPAASDHTEYTEQG
jgi:hypothetical protein